MKSKIILIVFMFLSSYLYASVGHVTYIKGKGVVKRAFTDVNVKVGLKLQQKDIIKSIDKSVIKMKFRDNTHVTIGKNSSLNVATFLYDSKKPKRSKLKFKFLQGAFKTISGKIGKHNPKMFELETRTATIGIRGTIIYGNQNNVAFTEGKGHVTSMKKRVNISAGQLIRTSKGKAPSAPIAIPRKFVNMMRDSLGSKEVNIRSKKGSQGHSSKKGDVDIQNSIFENKSEISDGNVKGNTGIYVGE